MADSWLIAYRPIVYYSQVSMVAELVIRNSCPIMYRTTSGVRAFVQSLNSHHHSGSTDFEMLPPRGLWPRKKLDNA